MVDRETSEGEITKGSSILNFGLSLEIQFDRQRNDDCSFKESKFISQMYFEGNIYCMKLHDAKRRFSEFIFKA